MVGHKCLYACLLLCFMWTEHIKGYCFDDNDCRSQWSPRCYNDTIRSYCTSAGSCENDADCGFSLLQCRNGYCQTSSCTTNDDCHDEHSACNYGSCWCKYGFRKLDEACVSVIGLKCRPHNGDLDCNGMQHDWMYGFQQYYDLYHICDTKIQTCKCDTDVLKEMNGVCTSYLGSECKSSLDCGRNSNTSCVDGTCTCGTGFVLRDSRCIWVMDAGCSSNEDCVYKGIECDTQRTEPFCRCPEGSALKSVHNATCVQVYGSSCADIHMCGDPDISYYRRSYHEIIYMYGSYYANKALHCDIDNVCTCAPGFKRNSELQTCYQIYGSPCVSDMDCSSNKANEGNVFVCNNGTQTCLCRTGYGLEYIDYWFSDQYVQIQGCRKAYAWYCEADEDCSATRDNSVCNSSSMCSCNDGFADHNDKCMLEVSICQEVVSALPDLYRRSPSYILTSTEPPIRDDRLKDTWYNIGSFMISHVEKLNGSSPGACGTHFPIYLTDPITDTEQNQVDTGFTVSKRAHIGGLQEFGKSYNMSIQMRKCGAEYLVKMQAPTIAFAAYCIDTDQHSVAMGNSTDRWTHLEQSLQFYSEIDEESLTEIYNPTVVFRCHPLDRYYNYYYTHYWGHCGGCPRYNYNNDGLFFTIHWYVDDLHCKTSDSVERSRLQESDLTESEIGTRCGERKFGFQIQCAFQWSETMFGRKSAPIFSKKIQTGFNAWTIGASAEGAFIVPSIHSTPIGCQSSSSNAEQTCLIKWDIAGFGYCPFETSNDEVCGLSILGLTRNGWYNYGTSNYAYWRLIFNDTYHPELNAYIMITNGFKIIVSSDVQTHTAIMLATFAPLTSDHELWNGYTIPKLRV